LEGPVVRWCIFDVKYVGLFDLLVNKLSTVAEMFSLGWDLNGETQE